MDQTCLANSGGFGPISFPLFHGARFGGSRIEYSSSMVILLELSEDGMVRRMPDPLNYGSFREWCRPRLGLGTIRAGAYDPKLPIDNRILLWCTTGLIGSVWSSAHGRAR